MQHTTLEQLKDKMKIVIDDKIPFIKGILEPFAEVEYLKGSEIRRKDLSEADALIVRTRTKCTKELLEGTAVKFIATATIGSDHIDTEWCNANNIKWTNAPGCNSGSVMQYLTAAILHLADKHNFNLSEKTLGVIGVGNVGKKVVEMASALGMKVLQNDPPRELVEGSTNFSSLYEVISQSDIITLHVPLTLTGEFQTFHLANNHFFSALKKGSFFINTSRGQVCNEKSLKNAIENKLLADCVLDVWETEPDPDLRLLEHCEIATPHIAGYSLDGKFNATTMVVKTLSQFFEITPNLPSISALPSPINKEIKLSDLKLNAKNPIANVIFKTYPIWEDSKRLKKDPSGFEEQRGNYQARREFGAFVLKGEHKIKPVLLQLGFSI